MKAHYYMIIERMLIEARRVDIPDEYIEDVLENACVALWFHMPEADKAKLNARTGPVDERNRIVLPDEVL